MSTPYNYFNPNTVNQLAKFQGTFSGIQAGNAGQIGVAAGPTSIYNQAGYYALQDPATGYVSIQKLGDDSMYTQNWYDQSTGMTFNLSSTTPQAPQGAMITTSTSPAFTGNAQPMGYTQYPWGPGTVVVNSSYGQNGDYNSGYQAGYNAGYQNGTNGTQPQTTGSADGTDAKDPAKELKASDLQDMVDCGIYENLEEAYEDVTKDGYWLNDKEAAKLGMYSEEDEEKITMIMDKFGCSRDEAIEKLGDKIQTANETNDAANKADLELKIASMMENGLSREEAVECLEELGYKVPEELKTEPPKYSEEDEAKIKAVMDATGCSREDAIKATGVKPEKDGLITKLFKGIGNGIKAISTGIKNGWDSFIEWLF